MNYIEEYKKCINDFDYWLKHYIKFIEYNTDTSAEHPIKDDDIVRYSSEKKRYKIKNLYITYGISKTSSSIVRTRVD